MAIRGKVKTVRVEPMGRSISGTVVDTATKKEYEYVQPFGEQLGIEVNSIVQFETVDLSSGPVAVSLDPVEKGTVEKIDYETGNGQLVDKQGNRYEFVQNYGKELGLQKGTVVKYAVVTVDGATKATALKPAAAAGSPAGSN